MRRESRNPQFAGQVEKGIVRDHGRSRDMLWSA